jgi:hypothetical protein
MDCKRVPTWRDLVSAKRQVVLRRLQAPHGCAASHYGEVNFYRGLGTQLISTFDFRTRHSSHATKVLERRDTEAVTGGACSHAEAGSRGGNRRCVVVLLIWSAMS